MRMPLTVRQQQVLDAIYQAIQLTGAPPTRAELAARLGFRSVNAAEEHLHALARKGAIELISGTSRGIRFTPDTLRNLQASQSTTARAASRSVDTHEMENTPFLSLPLVGRVAAGSPILAQEHADTHFKFSASLFAERPDYLLRIRGMSMSGIGILDGDILAVQKASDAHNGQVIVARVDNEVTVKRFFRRGDLISLQSESPNFKPMEIDPCRSDFSIEGRAVGLIRTSSIG